MTEMNTALERLTALLERLEPQLQAALPRAPMAADSSKDVIAWRWVNGLHPVSRPHQVDLDSLLGIERQKQLAKRNIAQFVQGLPANNMLLSGARGVGKSTLIKALLHEFSPQGLRLIEVDKSGLTQLPELTELLAGQDHRFLVSCDDLSFSAGEPGYQALKALLDGSISAPPENVLICATSNRRHLLPDYQQDNQAARMIEGEIHHTEAVEEQISLSERFGLWLSFLPFSQDLYLDIVTLWLAKYDQQLTQPARAEALRWALQRGSRSGRVARQFARDWAGRAGLNTGAT